jgi:type II secretory pathway pseudopilin PulG
VKFNLVELMVVVGLVAMVLAGTLLVGGAADRKVHKLKAENPAADLSKAWDDVFERRGRRPRGASHR